MIKDELDKYEEEKMFKRNASERYAQSPKEEEEEETE